jgi:hypothetical protein
MVSAQYLFQLGQYSHFAGQLCLQLLHQLLCEDGDTICALQDRSCKRNLWHTENRHTVTLLYVSSYVLVEQSERETSWDNTRIGNNVIHGF